MEVEFEAGKAVMWAAQDGGFDPTAIGAALADAGFGAGEVRLVARGILARYEELPALELPTAPGILVLGGGEGLDELEAAELAPDTRLRVEGELHPSHGGRPPGMTVEEWSVVGERPGEARSPGS